MVVAAIDVGSPKNVGWAILTTDVRVTGNDLDEFIERFSKLAIGKSAALGFEAPLFIPCHDEFKRITAQRPGEAGRPWSAGAGATVATIGIAVMMYTLGKLRMAMTAHRKATLDWIAWPELDDLLVFEAFVSGANHGAAAEHHRDALTAADGFVLALPNLDLANAVSGDRVLSLVGSCLVATGWAPASQEMLTQRCLVIRPDKIAEL